MPAAWRPRLRQEGWSGNCFCFSDGGYVPFSNWRERASTWTTEKPYGEGVYQTDGLTETRQGLPSMASQLVPSAKLTDSRSTELTAAKPVTQAYHLESGELRTMTIGCGGPRMSLSSASGPCPAGVSACVVAGDLGESTIRLRSRLSAIADCRRRSQRMILLTIFRHRGIKESSSGHSARGV
jgi:hypothetical protein